MESIGYGSATIRVLFNSGIRALSNFVEPLPAERVNFHSVWSWDQKIIERTNEDMSEKTGLLYGQVNRISSEAV
jgi:hypothetical protein